MNAAETTADDVREAHARRMRVYRATTGQRTARVNLADLGEVLERLDASGAALVTAVLGRDLAERARAAREHATTPKPR